jgi:nucleotide-binding universal stress UspA family protein
MSRADVDLYRDQYTMAIKDIVVALAPRDGADPARDYAVSMAEAYGAQLTAVAYPIVPPIPATLYPDFAAGLAKNIQEQGEAAVKGARERFEQAARAAGIAHSFHGFSSSANAVTTDFAVRLRTADIGILTQHRADDPERFGDMFTEAALFRSGRPVIIVPREHSGKCSTDRVLIAWDGSVHAARAVAAAIPLLQRANIEVFTVEEAPKGRDLRGSALIDHLREENGSQPASLSLIAIRPTWRRTRQSRMRRPQLWRQSIASLSRQRTIASA